MYLDCPLTCCRPYRLTWTKEGGGGACTGAAGLPQPAGGDRLGAGLIAGLGASLGARGRRAGCATAGRRAGGGQRVHWWHKYTRQVKTNTSGWRI